MAKKDMDQPVPQQGDRKPGDVRDEGGTIGRGDEEIRSISEEDQDEVDEEDELDENETEDGDTEV